MIVISSISWNWLWCFKGNTCTWRYKVLIRRRLGRDKKAGPSLILGHSGPFFGSCAMLLLSEECLQVLDVNVFFAPRTIIFTHHQFG